MFSFEEFEEFPRLAEKYKLSQEQVDFIMQQHAWRVKCLFNPKSYSYFTRIMLALYFLNPFVKGIK